MSPSKSFRLIQNNFDLLRLLFAGAVCLIHSYELSGFQQLKWVASILSSTVAVKAFFVVSGFLIFMSFERSSSFCSYAVKRIRRIYPAYFTIVMLAALGLVMMSSKNVSNYFSFVWIKYVVSNLLFMNFLQPALPGVFEANKLAAVNGALWTLKIEVMFYLAVPVFVWLFRKFSPLPVLALSYCLSLAYSVALNTVAERTGSAMYLELARQLPGQLCYFMAGAFFYYFLELFEQFHRYFVAVAVLILAANLYQPLPVLEPFALATLVIFLGLFLYLGNFGKYGDFSYGVYILHFPIIQTFLAAGWLHETPLLFLAAIVSTTVMSAVAMWHLVEKRFLFRSSHYIASTAPSDENVSSQNRN